jgi:hypothetical protein
MTAETINAAGPIEGRCDHCKRTLPLFLYKLDHYAHIDPWGFGCPWCLRDPQPLLCVACYSAEKLREEDDPRLAEETDVWERICATNRRYFERRQADKTAVDGIAAVSGMGQAS